MKRFILGVIAYFIFAGSAFAAAPEVMTYQGRLKENGLPVTGNRDITMKLCDDPFGGNCYLEPAAQSVYVSTGLFKSTFTLPSGVDLAAANDWYLQVDVNGTNLWPREKFTAVPYAIFSSSAVHASTASYAAALSVDSGEGVYSSTNVIISGGLMVSDWAVQVSTVAVMQASGMVYDDNPAGQDVRVGISGRVISNSTDNEDAALGGSFEAEIPAGMGGIAIGLRAATQIRGASPQAIAVMVDALENTGTLGNTYGVFIATLTAGTQSVPPYALYSEDRNARAYFAGNVGISSAAPAYALSVSSGAGEAGTIMAVSTGTTNLFWVAGDGAHATRFFGDGSGLSGVTGAVGTDSTKVLKTGDTMTGDLRMASGSTITVTGSSFSVGGSTLVVVSGMVGIGTPAPVHELEVSGEARVFSSSPTLYFAGSVTDIPGSMGYSASIEGVAESAARGLLFRTQSLGTYAERLRVTGTGNVGISTGTPAARLDIVSAGNTISDYAQIWRDSGGVTRASVTATGVFYGDGSGLTGVTGAVGTDSTKVLKAGDTMTGQLTISGSSLTVYALPTEAYSLAMNGIVVSTGGAIQTAGLGYGTATGTARGRGAVDLQTFRTQTSEIAAGDYSVLSGGVRNRAAGMYSVLSGGYTNSSAGTYSAVGGGQANSASTSHSVVAGGQSNTASGAQSAVAGGFGNRAEAQYAFVGGGHDNRATGMYSVVPGGYNNTAEGNYSFAAGGRSSSTAQGAFTWQDSGGAALNLINNVTDRTVFKSRGGFMVTGSTNASGLGGLVDRGVIITGNGLVGISTYVPQAALDIVSAGNTVSDYAQIWRDSGGVTRASVTATGVFYGDGSGLTGVTGATGTDSTKVLKAGDTMTGALHLSSTTISPSSVTLLGAVNIVNGNVGVGTTTPANKFHVVSAGESIFGQSSSASSTDSAVRGWTNGAATAVKGVAIGGGYAGRFEGTVLVGNDPAAANGKLSLWGTGSSHSLFVSTAANGAAPNFVVTNIGSVGAGTASPATRFEVFGGSITISGTEAGLLFDGAARKIAPTTDATVGGGLYVSTNVYTLGFSSATKYYGDGSALTGVSGTDATKLPLAGGTMTGNINMGGNHLYSVSTVTASGDITAARYQINGSTVLAILPGTDSLGVGVSAGAVNTGSDNVFVGSYAGLVNTSGGQNSFTGSYAGYSNTTGGVNSFFGYAAGIGNTTGGYNTFVGNQAGQANSTGANNSFVGYAAGWGSAAGSASVIIGNEAGGAGGGGGNISSSTILGYRAGHALSNSSDNIFIGWQAGYAVTTGTGNIVIGYDQDTSAPTASNELNIGGVLFGDLSLKEIYIGKGANVSTITPTGFFGDGSGLSNIPGDSLGNHVATTTLDMAQFPVINVASMTMVGDGIRISTSVYAGASGVFISTAGSIHTLGKGSGTAYPNARGIGAVDLQTNRINVAQVASGIYATISGGFQNTASGEYSVVSGGAQNTTVGSRSTISGGQSNTANAQYAAVSGGYQNTASGYAATVAGGQSNTASGSAATVSGGWQNTALGQYSWAGGYHSSSTANGSFTWSDSKGFEIRNTAANRALFKNEGGFMVAGSTVTGSAILPVNQGMLDIISTGTTVNQYAQVWRDSDGVAKASVTATGVFYGDGSGLSGVIATDNTKLPLAGGTMTGTLYMGGNFLSGVSTITMLNGSIAIVPPGTGGSNNEYGISIGSNSYNNYNSGVGVGYGAYDNYTQGVGVGQNASNNHTYGVGLGNSASNNNTYGVGIGDGAGNNYDSGVGVGNAAYGNHSHGVGVGYFAYDNFQSGVGIGRGAGGNANHAVGVGAYSQNTQPYGAALGAYSYAATSSTALGSYAKANARDSVAIGAWTVNNATGTASFGGYVLYTSSDIVAVGSITANAFFGDGSGLSNVAGDSLGNHVATTTLNMAQFPVINVASMTMVGDGIRIATSVYAGASGVFISTGGAIQTTGLGHGAAVGNARGTGAVDLQTHRTDVAQVASGAYATVSGGESNTASNVYATVSGGRTNLASGGYSAIPGGSSNRASGSYAAVSGGYNNTADGYAATVSGGFNNAASGGNATVSGGRRSGAHGEYSWAGGYLSSSTANGSFTWADSKGFEIRNTAADRALFKNEGGFMVVGSTVGGTAILPANQGMLDIISTGTTVNQYAQVWRDSDGVAKASVTASGVFYGDGSGLTGVSGTDATKLPLAGGTMQGSIDMAGNFLSGVSTITMLTGSIAIVPPGTGGNNDGYGISIGSNSYNNYSNGVGVGHSAFSNYTSGVGVGSNADNNHSYGVGVGNSATNNYTSGVGVGSGAGANYSYGVGVGVNATQNSNYGVGLGAYAQNNDDHAVGVGAYSQNNAPYGAALGAYSYAASSSVALGYGAKANAWNSVAIGSGTVNNSTGTASFGILAVHTSTAVNAAYYQINGSTVLALMPGRGLNVGPLAGRISSGANSVFVGDSAGHDTTTGHRSTFLGNDAGRLNITGINNSYLGYGSGLSNTVGNDNTVVGTYAAWYNQTGSANAILGVEAGMGVMSNSFSSSTLVGYQAGKALTTGSDNILLGFRAGDNLTSGSRNIIIGYDLDATAPTISDEIRIGSIIYGNMATGGVGLGAANTLPAAVLDVKSTGTASNVYAQIWRDGAGVVRASVTSEGRFSGDGSGLSGVTATDNTKLPLAGGTLTGNLELSAATMTVTATGSSADMIVARLSGGPAVAISADGSKGQISTKSTARLALGANTAETLTIATGGKVGINKIDPEAALDVSGTTRLLVDTATGYLLTAGLVSQPPMFFISTSGIMGLGDFTTQAASTDTLLNVHSVLRPGYDLALGLSVLARSDPGATISVAGEETGVLAGNFEAEAGGDDSMEHLAALRTQIRREGGVGGTVQNAAGIWVDHLYSDGGGMIVNTYGLRISTLTAPGQTNAPYAIYSEDRNARTYLAGNLGISSATPVAALVISSAAGSSDKMLIVSTGTTEVFSVKGNGEVYTAGKFIGDGSMLTNLTGDGLGSHIATTTLQMGAYGINSSSAVNAAYYQVNGSTILAMLPGVASLGVGVEAGRINTGTQNTFIGVQAAYANTTGEGNSFLGYRAGYANTTGIGNSFLGKSAAYNNTVGSYNSFLGHEAGLSNITGVHNSYLGYAAGYNNQAGSGNSVVGSQAGRGAAMQSYSSSTIMGFAAGYNLAAGADNIFIGWQAGYNVTTGTRNIIIGYDQRAFDPTDNNVMNIGGVLFGDLHEGAIGINSARIPGGIQPQAALDIISTATASNIYSQIWRDGAGVVRASVTSEGVFYGNGSGLTNINAVAKTGDTMSGPLLIFSGMAQTSDLAMTSLVVSTGGAIQTTGVGHGTMPGNPRGLGAVDLQTSRDLGGKVASGNYSVISGGRNNWATGLESAVAGGYINLATGYQSFVGGGASGTAQGTNTAVVGGSGNKANADYSAIVGGSENIIALGGVGYSFIGGGYQNYARGEYAAVLGGYRTHAAGNYAIALGGDRNSAKGNWSLAAGRRSSSTVAGTFTWSDSADVEVENNVMDRAWFKTRGGFLVTASTQPHVDGKFQAGMMGSSFTVQVNGDLALGAGDPMGNKPVTIWLYNFSSAARSYGDIVILDLNNDNAFRCSNVGSTTTVVGVVYDQNINMGDPGRVAIHGVVDVKTNTAVTRGDSVVASLGDSCLADSRQTSTIVAGAGLGKWLQAGGGGGTLKKAVLVSH